MTTIAIEVIQQDSLAMSVARALTIANTTAKAQGVDLTSSVLTISEQAPPPTRVWRIHYGPRDCTRSRGGEFIVVVDDQTGSVQRTMRGQ